MLILQLFYVTLFLVISLLNALAFMVAYARSSLPLYSFIFVTIYMKLLKTIFHHLFLLIYLIIFYV